MGMYDYLQSEVPMPDGWEHPEFQTKDLNCELDRYQIAADGRLMIERFDMEPVGEPKQHPFFDSWKDWQEERRVNVRWEPYPHHGDVWFYSYDGDVNSAGWKREDHWHEYRARFTAGVLTELVTIESPPIPQKAQRPPHQSTGA